MQDKWEKIYRDDEVIEVFTKDQFDKALSENKQVRCPCCGKEYNTLYRRKVYKAMIDALVRLNRGFGGIHHSSVGDFTKLQHWGLVQNNGESGWSITDDGREFLAGSLDIPKYVYLINNVPVGYSEQTIYVDGV